MKRHFLRDFLLPLSDNVSYREKLYSGLAGLIGIFLVAWISRLTLGHEGMIFMAASMGSAAVLVFATPHSPMAQPWPLVGGQVVSALVGVLCYQWITSTPVAAATAIGLAIVAMFFLRCLNPPGGSAALGAVLGGPAIHELGFNYVLVPVGLNVMILLLVALVINNLLSGRRYPSRLETIDEPPSADVSWALGQHFIDDSDLDKAIASIDSYIDADREDLKNIYRQASLNSYKRRLGHVSCADIMTKNPSTVSGDCLLVSARQIMKKENRRTLPVINEHQHVIGQVMQQDLLMNTSSTAVVADVMRSKTMTVLANQHILDITSLTSEKEWRRVWVIDDEQRLLGIITRSDILRALLSLR